MEKYQEDRIKLIKELLPLLGDNYILKGGTALKLYYGLDRYSDDIDLDSVSGYMNIKNHLLKHTNSNDWEILHKKDTSTVGRFMIDYKATNHNGAYPLKIEISSRNKNLLEKGLIQYDNIDGVNVYTLNEIIRQKLTAFGNRDKIRDFYDIAFLLEKHEDKFSSEQILSFYEKSQYKGLDNLSSLLKDEIVSHKLKQNIDTDELVLKTMMKCENILDKRNNNIETTSEVLKEIRKSVDLKNDQINTKLEDKEDTKNIRRNR